MNEINDKENDYSAGYYSCESELQFDETKSDLWKQGYKDKEKERLIRSVKYHLDYVSEKKDCCCYLMDNDKKLTGVEYCCYYFGKTTKNCKCEDKMLQDFLRLYVE